MRPNIEWLKIETLLWDKKICFSNEITLNVTLKEGVFMMCPNYNSLLFDLRNPDSEQKFRISYNSSRVYAPAQAGVSRNLERKPPAHRGTEASRRT